MWNIYRDTNNSYACYNNKMALNNATKAIRSSKRSLEKITCNTINDLKAFYRYARKKIKTKDSVGALIKDNDDVKRDSPCVASMLSRYVASAFSAEDTNNLPLVDTSTYRDIDVLGHIELSSCTIYKKLMNFKPENLQV